MATLYLTAQTNIPQVLSKIDRSAGKTWKNIERLEKQAKKFNVPNFKSSGFSDLGVGSKLASTGMNLLSKAMTSFAVAGGLATYQFFSINSQLEQMEILLKTATGSAQLAEKALDRMFKFAETSPFSIDSITDSFVKLKTAGLKDVDSWISTLTDSVAAFGGSSNQLKLVTIAIQQMAGKGVISMEELRRQLGEQVPTAIRAMASELKMSVLDMVDLISKGGLTSDLGLPALQSGLDKLHTGSASARMKSFQGAVAQAMNEWKRLLRDIGKGEGAFSSISEAIVNAAKALKSFRTSETGAKIIGNISAKISEAFKKLAQDPDSLVRVFEYIGSSVDKVITPIKYMNDTLEGTIGIIDNIKQLKTLDLFNISDGSKFRKITDDNTLAISRYRQELNDLESQLDKTDIFEAATTFNVKSKIDYVRNLISGVPFLGKPQEFKLTNEEAKLRIKEIKEKIKELEVDSPKITLDFDSSNVKFTKIQDAIDAEKLGLSMDKFFDAKDYAATLSSMVDKFDSSTGEMANSYLSLKDKVEEYNKQIADSSLDMKDDLRDIMRDGMTDTGAWKDTIAQINEYKRSAAEAGSAGNWKEQIKLLERAYSLMSSLSTSGIKEKITNEDVKKAREYFEYINRITRGGKVAGGADKYNKALANYEKYLKGIKEGGIETVSKQEQIAEKIKLAEQLQKSLNEAREKEKQNITDTAEKMKQFSENLQSYSEQAQKLISQFNEGIAGSYNEWIKVGDKWELKVTSIETKMLDLIAKIQEANAGLNDATSKANTLGDSTKARAMGGPVTRGQQYLVGEKGPELFTPNLSGFITPNKELSKSTNREIVDLNFSINNSDPVKLSGIKKDIIKLKRMLQEDVRYAS